MLKSDATVRIYLQYYEKEINLTRIVKKAYLDGNAQAVQPVREMTVYVKPEDERAYYVMDGKFSSYVNLWDSDRDIKKGSELSGEINWHSEVKRRLIFEYRGRQCDCDGIINRILDKYAHIHLEKNLQEIEIYVRQEDETAYYVVDGRHTGAVPMFC